MYIKEEQDCYKKYDVIYNKSDIELLRVNAINEASLIKHKEYDSGEGPYELNYFKIRNLKSKKVGRHESRDELQYPSYDIYHYSYDEYNFPYLVTLLDKFLDKDYSVIPEILNPDYSKEEKPLSKKVEELDEEINQISNMDVKLKKEKLEEMKQLLDTIKLNKNQKNIKNYYEKFKSLISLELVDTISKEEVNRVNSFFINNNDYIKKER